MTEKPKKPKKTRTKTRPCDIRAALRLLWLRCPERRDALKREQYTCQGCKKKQSKAEGREFKVEVHHKVGVLNWQAIEEAVQKYLICDAELLKVLCEDCHKKEHVCE